VLLDAFGSEPQGIENLRGGRGNRRLDVGLAHPQADAREIHLVETGGIIEEGRIAAMAHIIDDGADDGVHVFRYFALGRQKSGKPLFEIVRCLFQPDCHLPWSP
jgi:hypothetical protein